MLGRTGLALCAVILAGLALGAHAEPTIPDAAALLQTARDERAEGSAEATNALYKLGREAAASVPLFVEALQDPDHEVRELVARVLCKIDPAGSSAPALVRALSDSHGSVREAAAATLQEFWSAGQGLGPEADEAIPVLLRLVDGKDPYAPRQKETAAAALAALGPRLRPFRAALLETALRPENDAAKQEMLPALAALGAEAHDALPWIEGLTKNPSQPTATRAGRAVSRILHPAVPLLGPRPENGTVTGFVRVRNRDLRLAHVYARRVRRVFQDIPRLGTSDDLDRDKPQERTYVVLTVQPLAPEDLEFPSALETMRSEGGFCGILLVLDQQGRALDLTLIPPPVGSWPTALPEPKSLTITSNDGKTLAGKLAGEGAPRDAVTYELSFQAPLATSAAAVLADESAVGYLRLPDRIVELQHVRAWSKRNSLYKDRWKTFVLLTDGAAPEDLVLDFDRIDALSKAAGLTGLFLRLDSNGSMDGNVLGSERSNSSLDGFDPRISDPTSIEARCAGWAEAPFEVYFRATVEDVDLNFLSTTVLEALWHGSMEKVYAEASEAFRRSSLAEVSAFADAQKATWGDCKLLAMQEQGWEPQAFEGNPVGFQDCSLKCEKGYTRGKFRFVQQARRLRLLSIEISDP